LVQGVGFRPFVYRIAIENKLKGWVDNRNDGVHISITETEIAVQKFVEQIKNEAPLASKISNIEITEIEFENFANFEIVKSKNISNEITQVSPDIVVCDDCLQDLKSQKNRINYPFINCTNCGPRFSIIKNLPYDREKTTMSVFEMCDDCKTEYTNVLDRRFHAQPIACEVCGPKYSLYVKSSSLRGKNDRGNLNADEETMRLYTELVECVRNDGEDFNEILTTTANLINEGKIVAIKGLGGFFISCDASNEKAIETLRLKKNREKKPFAVMFKDLETVEEFAFLNEPEKKSIQNWQRPIVLLKSKSKLPSGISNGLKNIGSMLPYMPLHFLLFEKLNFPAIVLTSGNISDEPIVIDNEIAIEKLSKICDTILTYNRDIYNRVDDSVIAIFNKEEKIFRRSRGFVPSPIEMPRNVDGILAVGAELSNTFCIGKNNQAIISQHIGDLKNIETLNFFEETISRFQKLFRVQPNIVVSDLHPDYLSSKFASKLGVQHIQVQHHHAHIASCMAEHNIDENVIGIAFDGTGLGDDGNIWGSEFFVCDFEYYERITHFEYIALPGGDKTSKEAWRVAISYLYKVFGKDFLDLEIPFIQNLDKEKAKFVLMAIDQKINSPLSSSSGRLFDAVSAIINLCTHLSYQAEAPMLLEAILEENCVEKYSWELTSSSLRGKNDRGNLKADEETICFNKTIFEIVQDVKNNISTSKISAKFHNTIVDVIIENAQKIRNQTQLNKMVLSGGTFQNRYLTENVEIKLKSLNFEVFTQSKIPMNDGGISFGQLAIASKKTENKLRVTTIF
jgi:hydrogenase maturation protein HypF